MGHRHRFYRQRADGSLDDGDNRESDWVLGSFESRGFRVVGGREEKDGGQCSGLSLDNWEGRVAVY